ncbi:hypothetical protein ABEB36_011855 [Hypothenemus hampei]|uniref:Sperm-associated antigen 1 n=1 Tax=Hypothenemus hampei TaxID=57062 RepID=A0ABD1E998_HYPHA
MAATFEDLQNGFEYENCNRKGESLLEKYKIPIQHFDFDYVSKSRDANELEKMIEVLRSGQEGFYPDLMRCMEKKLSEIRPTSKCLRRSQKVLNRDDLKKEEIDSISADLQNWAKNVSRSSKELQQHKTDTVRCDVEVRQQSQQNEPLNLMKKKPQKISATDYQAWDRYDPDTELMKVDLQDAKLRQKAIETEKERRQVEHYSLNHNNLKELKQMSEAEANFYSQRELDKGREFFRSGDYEMALNSFTRSLTIKPNLISYNNRALTQLKLKNYQDALQDCHKALEIEPKNLKALLRKGSALEGLKMYEEALDCIDDVIRIDPNNTSAQELAERVRKFCRNVLQNTRMKIVEIQ